MIRSGHVNEVNWDSGSWVFLDVGFSNNLKSCGLLIGDNTPIGLRFGEVLNEISSYVINSSAPINLVLEAPLSVAFDKNGNPKGRSIEKENQKTRYWYVGLGCTVMVAVMYMLKELERVCSDKEIRLFEGFVSFKEKQSRTSHLRDVLLLREVVKAPLSFQEAIVSAENLIMDKSDVLQSAFIVAGRNYGIPPVIMRNG
jgi:hypothetical protein